MAGWRLERTGFERIPGWNADRVAEAFNAFRRSAPGNLAKPYRTGTLGIAFGDLAPLLEKANHMSPVSDAAARLFFESGFVPFHIAPDTGPKGFVTGYYEPVVEASPVKTPHFRYPVYGRPGDLVEIEEGAPAPGVPEGYRFARRGGAGFQPYHDRAAIEQGALEGRGLEIAWLAGKVDLFFIHVQGAARLAMTDGSEKRVTYAAKSGHPFTGPGKVLAQLGEIPLEDVTMQSIRAWLADHPERIDEILWQNRSFIFFRLAEVDDPALGPVAAAKVPLSAGRSLAVDRIIHTFATPFFIDAPELTVTGGKPFQRLMIAQDTGSAITGPARGDLFFGSGDAAGEMAGVVKHPADFFVLIPATAAGRIAP